MNNAIIFRIYKEIKEAFLSNKIIILISSLMFFIPLILGFIFSNYFSSYFEPVVTDLSKNLAEGTIEFNFETVFLNNISIIFKEYLMGLFFFVFTVYILIYNGSFLGYYLGDSNNLFNTLILIVPHGIFEFFSIIIGASSGFLLCIFILKLIYNIIYPDYSKDKISLYDRLNFSLEKNYIKFKHSLILFAVSCIAMLIAGFIEVYITLYLSEIIFNLYY